MSQPRSRYLARPDQIDMDEEERSIRLWTSVALILVVLGFAAGRLLLPDIVPAPGGPQERLAIAAIGIAANGVVLLVAILMVSTARRGSPDDIGGQAAGPPSRKLAIKSAFLQNTLEQTVLAAAFFLGLAAIAGGQWMALVPISVAFFWIGRLLFYLGYEGGAGGRALGMALTMTPSITGYLLLAGLAIGAFVS